MQTSDFSGAGDALLTAPLVGYRSWTLDMEVRPVPGLPPSSFEDWYRLMSDLPGGKQIGSVTMENQYDNTFQGWAGINGVHTVPPHDTTRRDPTTGEPYLIIPGTSDHLARVTLHPVGQPTGGEWPLTKEAVCLHHPQHAAPTDGCTCGIYSWYRPDEASQEHSAVITGVVHAEGQVIMGRRGLRSSRARVVAVTINEELRHLLARVMPPDLVIRALRRQTGPGRLYEGVRVFDTEQELYDAFPPDLDTVANLVGREVIDDLQHGGQPVITTWTPFGTGAQLVAGHHAMGFSRAVNRHRATLWPWPRTDMRDGVDGD